MVLRTQRNTGRVAQDLPSSPVRFVALPLKSLKSLLIPTVALAPFVLYACGGTSSPDYKDGLATDLGKWVDADHDGVVDQIDINHDGRVDGNASVTPGWPTAGALCGAWR